MKCPMSFSGNDKDCIKDDCAWYDAKAKWCVVFDIAYYLAKIADNLKKEKKND